MGVFKQNEDYYINEHGYWVFTAQYLLNRGYCCKSGCLHCPYGFLQEKKADTEKTKEK